MLGLRLTPALVHGALTGALLLMAAGMALAQGPQRVVAAGGSGAEIVYALGQGDRLVARDTTSMYPPEVMELPDIGYVRSLSAENLIAMSPDLVLAEHDAGPPEAIGALEGAGVNIVHLPQGLDEVSVAAKIATVAEALGVPEEGARLNAQLAEEMAEARALAAALPKKPRVMFILSMAGGRIMAAGQHNAGDAIIALAGGENAVQGYTGYKQLTDEAALTAAPEIILMMDRGGEHDAAIEEVIAHPALAGSPAAKGRHVIRMDGLYLLGFGPRTGQAAADLARAFAAALAGEAPKG